MISIRTSLLALLIAVTTGCTNKQIYEATQPKYTEAECITQNLPKSKHYECVQKEAVSYDDYERERQDLLNEKPK